MHHRLVTVGLGLLVVNLLTGCGAGDASFAGPWSLDEFYQGDFLIDGVTGTAAFDEEAGTGTLGWERTTEDEGVSTRIEVRLDASFTRTSLMNADLTTEGTLTITEDGGEPSTLNAEPQQWDCVVDLDETAMNCAEEGVVSSEATRLFFVAGR